MKRLLIAATVVIVLALAWISVMAAGERKVTLCHKGNTLSVGEPAAAAHYAHGDRPGPCPISPSK